MDATRTDGRSLRPGDPVVIRRGESVLHTIATPGGYRMPFTGDSIQGSALIREGWTIEHAPIRGNAHPNGES